MHRLFVIFALFTLYLAVPGAQAADSVKVQISKKDCARVVEHVPSDDVAYKAGVDAHGRAVKPADLPGSTLQVPLPDVLEFDIAFNPLKGNSKSKFAETSLSVGKIRYDINRRKITFDGQPLANDNLAVLAAKCKEIMGSGK
jgi:hypothetical protein